jgi:hypothetical protein
MNLHDAIGHSPGILRKILLDLEIFGLR